MIIFTCGCVYENAKDKELLQLENCKSLDCDITAGNTRTVKIPRSTSVVQWINSKLEIIRVDKEKGFRINE